MAQKKARNNNWFPGMKSPNPKGRPKGSGNKNTAAARLRKALSGGHDLKKLKEVALDIINTSDDMSSATVERLLSKLMDVELKLMDMEFRAEKDGTKDNSVEDEEDDVVVFRTTAE